MNDEQFNKAAKLKDQRYEVEKELGVWEKELTRKDKLGYLQEWNNNHATKLDTNISTGVFDGFRCAAMDNLKLKLVAIDKQFGDL